MQYMALLLPVCLCWPARHLPAMTTAAALIIAAAGSRGGTASLAYLIPVLAVTFVLSYRLGNAGGGGARSRGQRCWRLRPRSSIPASTRSC
jgi:hypothetical protein